MNQIPLYKHTAEYARENGELEIYRASLNANMACKEAIESAIRKYFDGMHLDKGAVSEALNAYGMERTCYVVANSVKRKSWDGRFSHANKEWADQFEIVETDRPDYESRCQFVVESHPAVFDGFINILRREHLMEREKPPSLYAALEKARAQAKRRPQTQAKTAKRKEPER